MKPQKGTKSTKEAAATDCKSVFVLFVPFCG